MDAGKLYLDSLKNRLQGFKTSAEKTMAKLTTEQLHWQTASEPNNIYIIVKHMSGNMLSRFTDFLTTDGEKPWRKRDDEFVDDPGVELPAILEMWEKGWASFFAAIDAVQPEDLGKTIYIRNEAHTVMDALNRQGLHHASHVGQILYIGKILLAGDWESLSIPKGKSDQFNAEKFSK
ncbi:uncharacterized protein DUF1572 [Chitinophaga skermanii]|uniref:Uncharacterized protein DUF1572 n=1 Tax=Chitinophaga skermanii TaxID=331697 RepID=A0A327QU29_9BACT|nr:DUF1572 family protein [Chitinophaga skermanii]RAJ05257.1 uncharacterized protein DUF1572 [Chitinophaga skermanii]